MLFWTLQVLLIPNTVLSHINSYKKTALNTRSNDFIQVTVNFVFLEPTNKDKPPALTAYEHLGVRLCS